MSHFRRQTSSGRERHWWNIHWSDQLRQQSLTQDEGVMSKSIKVEEQAIVYRDLEDCTIHDSSLDQPRLAAWVSPFSPALLLTAAQSYSTWGLCWEVWAFVAPFIVNLFREFLSLKRNHQIKMSKSCNYKQYTRLQVPFGIILFRTPPPACTCTCLPPSTPSSPFPDPDMSPW